MSKQLTLSNNLIRNRATSTAQDFTGLINWLSLEKYED